METIDLTDPGFRARGGSWCLGVDGPIPPWVRVPEGLVFFETSGSMGAPKWIGHRWEALEWSAERVNRHLGVVSSSVWGLALPMYHVGGFGVRMRARLSGSRCVVWSGRWSAEGALAQWRKEGVTHLSLVPTQVHDLVQTGLRAPASLEVVVVGGGRLEERLGRRARELGWPVLASYGMTETGSQIATQKRTRLGEDYTPMPVDLIDGWEAREDAEGRLVVRGEGLYRGRLLEAGGEWKYEERSSSEHVTSDRGCLRERELEILGRVDAVVKILGELVDPLAVEAEIAAAAEGRLGPEGWVVVAVTDARAGARLVAAHREGLDAGELRRAVEAYQDRCPGHRRISGIFPLSDWPLSGLGKPLRREIASCVEKAFI